ncbi:MAG TPA: hypothetical protein VHB79_36240 [Polyangiaceae bacterium]|nr:hypothetical protein [Polyangiaceae bacterium]
MRMLSLALGVTLSISLAAACSGSESHHDTPSTAQGGAAAGEGSNVAGKSADSSGSGGSAAGDVNSEGGGGIVATTGGEATGGSGAGSDSEGGAGGAGRELPLDSAAFCDAFAKRVCEFAETCQKFADCTTWGGYQNWVRECQDARASEKGGYLEFSPERAATCLTAAEQEACIGGGPLFFRADVNSVCSKVFAGTVAKAGECTSADFASEFDECKDGYCNRQTQAGRVCLGSCVPYLNDGDDCATGGLCKPGSYCQDGKCGAPRAVGESCSSAVCAPPLVCGGATPTCRDVKPVGGACKDSYDCTWPAGCVKGKCADMLDVGTPCRDFSSCKTGTFCKFTGDAKQVCTALVAANKACDPNYDQCVEGYGCSWLEPHVCVKAQGAAEEPCGPNGCEAGLWCEYTAPYTGTCHARVGLGEACDNGAACEDGLYCVGDPGKCGAPGGEGAPCAVFDDPTCIGDLFCARDTVKCTKPRAKGQTCNPYEPLGSCQTGLYCACLTAGCPAVGSAPNPDDVCTVQKANDADCNNAYECKSGYCYGGKCATAPAGGNCTR